MLASSTNLIYLFHQKYMGWITHWQRVVRGVNKELLSEKLTHYTAQDYMRPISVQDLKYIILTELEQYLLINSFTLTSLWCNLGPVWYQPTILSRALNIEKQTNMQTRLTKSKHKSYKLLNSKQANNNSEHMVSFD